MLEQQHWSGMTDSSDDNLLRPLQIGEWLVDPRLDTLRSGDRQVKLEPRAMRLLCVLAAQPGAVYSVEELLDRVWPGLVVSQNSVYQAVAQLRRALGDDGDEPRYVMSVPRKGYRLIAQVTDPQPPSPSEVAAPEQIPPMSSRGWWVWGAALAGLVVLVSAAVYLGRDPARSSPGTQTGPMAVAVLPFADLSAGAGEPHFSEGLTDEIINSLGRVPGLQVTGRTSAFQLPRDRSDPRELGQLLGVTHVLQGSVRTNQGRVRVSARLVNTTDGFQVWSNNYDRSRSDAIGVQTDIAREIVESLQLRLTPEAQQAVGELPTAQFNAYDLYLLGRHQQLQRNPEALLRAQEHYRKAIELDPRFALAYAGLADAQMAGYYYSNQSLEDTASQVESSIQSALAIDSELPEAYSARAVLRMEQWRLDEAIADLQRAIAINPNVGEFYQRLGGAFEYAGRPRDALAAYDQVQSLDPLHTLLHVRRCLVLQNLGKHAEAAQACGRAFELQPDIPNHLWAAGLNDYAQGRLTSAIANYEKALARAPQRSDIRGEMALLLLDLGNPAEADRTFERALEDAGPREWDLRVARLQVLLARNERSQLRSRLVELKLPAQVPARHAIALAYLAEAVGERSLASRWLRRAGSAPQSDADSLAPGVYGIRWGRCELCQYALLLRREKQEDRALVHENRMLARLDELEGSGHAWHGLNYLRASLLAQQGRTDAALAALERAVNMGWRRAWFAAADPAMSALRARPEFERLLRRMQARTESDRPG
jgi:TolB-like protein/DNA-binding winged helix-turn-helix (wHTH) protein/tetratricopeptide (TPR) repeat protein